MANPYFREEVLAILGFAEDFGEFTYSLPVGLPERHFQKTGIRRSHKALYMAYWRAKNGFYDHLLSGK